MRGLVVGIRHYGGDPANLPDDEVVSESVRTLNTSGQATAGYGLDLGVLSSGQTALVERNDGFSLGSYGNSFRNPSSSAWKAAGALM